MPIKIKIGDTTPEGGETDVKMSFKARKSVDGHIMLMDHPEIDIVVMPDKKKIVSFPKKSFQDSVYAAQDRLFNYLGAKGVIKRDSVRSGNVYGSLECDIPEPIQGVNPIQIAVFTIGKFFEEEKPHMEMEEYIKDDFEERVTDPDEEESTELGEVPQKSEKGSIPKRMNAYQSRRSYVAGIYQEGKTNGNQRK